MGWFNPVHAAQFLTAGTSPQQAMTNYTKELEGKIGATVPKNLAEFAEQVLDDLETSKEAKVDITALTQLEEAVSKTEEIDVNQKARIAQRVFTTTMQRAVLPKSATAGSIQRKADSIQLHWKVQVPWYLRWISWFVPEKYYEKIIDTSYEKTDDAKTAVNLHLAQQTAFLRFLGILAQKNALNQSSSTYEQDLQNCLDLVQLEEGPKLLEEIQNLEGNKLKNCLRMLPDIVKGPNRLAIIRAIALLPEESELETIQTIAKKLKETDPDQMQRLETAMRFIANPGNLSKLSRMKMGDQILLIAKFLKGSKNEAERECRLQAILLLPNTFTTYATSKEDLQKREAEVALKQLATLLQGIRDDERANAIHAIARSPLPAILEKDPSLMGDLPDASGIQDFILLLEDAKEEEARAFLQTFKRLPKEEQQAVLASSKPIFSSIQATASYTRRDVREAMLLLPNGSKEQIQEAATLLHKATTNETKGHVLQAMEHVPFEATRRLGVLKELSAVQDQRTLLMVTRLITIEPEKSVAQHLKEVEEVKTAAKEIPIPKEQLPSPEMAEEALQLVDLILIELYRDIPGTQQFTKYAIALFSSDESPHRVLGKLRCFKLQFASGPDRFGVEGRRQIEEKMSDPKCSQEMAQGVQTIALSLALTKGKRSLVNTALVMDLFSIFENLKPGEINKVVGMLSSSSHPELYVQALKKELGGAEENKFEKIQQYMKNVEEAVKQTSDLVFILTKEDKSKFENPKSSLFAIFANLEPDQIDQVAKMIVASNTPLKDITILVRQFSKLTENKFEEIQSYFEGKVE